jgi:hypothetical protein
MKFVSNFLLRVICHIPGRSLVHQQSCGPKIALQNVRCRKGRSPPWVSRIPTSQMTELKKPTDISISSNSHNWLYECSPRLPSSPRREASADLGTSRGSTGHVTCRGMDVGEALAISVLPRSTEDTLIWVPATYGPKPISTSTCRMQKEI